MNATVTFALMRDASIPTAMNAAPINQYPK
jgi:hypothetical protein